MKPYAIIVVPLLLNLLAATILSVAQGELNGAINQELRAKALLAQAFTVWKLANDAGVCMSAYTFTGSSLFYERYVRIAKQIPDDLQQLKQLTTGNAAQLKLLQKVCEVIDQENSLLKEMKSDKDNKQLDVAKSENRHPFARLRKLGEELQDLLKQLTEDERRRDGPEELRTWQDNIRNCIFTWISVQLLAAALLIAYVKRDKL